MTNSDQKLKAGMYRISFDISIDREDKLDTADIAQAIASGFEETPLLPKISNLDVLALAKTGFSPGDVVELTNDLEVVVNIKEQDGDIFIDASKEANNLGSTRILLKQGSQGIIGKNAENGIEVLNLDSSVFVPLQDPETDDIVDYRVAVNAVILPTTSLEKVGSEEIEEDVE